MECIIGTLVGEEKEGECPRTDCVEEGDPYFSITNFWGGLYTSVGLSECEYKSGSLIYVHTLTAYQVSCNIQVHWLFVSSDADPNFELLFTTQDGAYLISGNISKNGNIFEKEISIIARVI